MKNLFIGLMTVLSSSAYAADSCTKVVVNAFSVYYPAEIGTEKICTLNLSMVDVSFGRYPELGLQCLTTVSAFEKLTEIQCPDNRKLVLLNIEGTDSNKKEITRVYGVFSKDLIR